MRKTELAIIAVILTIIAPTSQATTTTPQTGVQAETSFEHGGGCRKDSPPGLCCHAGSKPYHCH